MNGSSNGATCKINSLHDGGFFKEEFPVKPVGGFSEHFDCNFYCSLCRVMVRSRVDFSEGSTANQLAEFDVVPLDPVLVPAEQVLLQKMVNF